MTLAPGGEGVACCSAQLLAWDWETWGLYPAQLLGDLRLVTSLLCASVSSLHPHLLRAGALWGRGSLPGRHSPGAVVRGGAAVHAAVPALALI